MTIDDFRRILIGCAGQSDADLSGDILDVPFEDLGYDSLALMQSAVMIQQQFGVKVPDEHLTNWKTPRDVLEGINGVLAVEQ